MTNHDMKNQNNNKGPVKTLAIVILSMGMGAGLTLAIPHMSAPKKPDTSADTSQNTSLKQAENNISQKRPAYSAQATAHRSSGGHISKNFIAKNCALMTIEAEFPVTGAAFINVEKTDEGADTDSTHIFLALSHGENGSALYDIHQNKPVWHRSEPAKIVSSFKNTLLIYNDTKTGSSLERFAINTQGAATLTATESPSNIAPTTLQRSAIAKLGPSQFTDNGLLLEYSFIKFGQRPSAIAASSQPILDKFPTGAVAIGFQDGSVELWDQVALKEGCD